MHMHARVCVHVRLVFSFSRSLAAVYSRRTQVVPSRPGRRQGRHSPPLPASACPGVAAWEAPVKSVALSCPENSRIALSLSLIPPSRALSSLSVCLCKRAFVFLPSEPPLRNGCCAAPPLLEKKKHKMPLEGVSRIHTHNNGEVRA